MPGTDKDKNSLWFEMPPSVKNRDKQAHYQPVNVNKEAEAENNGRADKTGKKRSKQNDKIIAKEKRRSAKTQSQEKKQSKADKKADMKSGRSKPPLRNNQVQQPEYLGENDIRRINVAKPMDIQSKALKNKKRTNTDQYGRRKRRLNPMRYIYYVVLFGVAAAVAIYILSTTVLFNVENFEVISDSQYTEEQVIEACGVANGENMIKLDKSAAESRLIENLPYIDKAEVSVKLPNTLSITITQASAAANVRNGDRYYLVSENGRIMDAELAKPNPKYVVVEGFGAEYAVSGDFLAAANEGSRNNIAKLLNTVKKYAGVDENSDETASKKYPILFELIKAIRESGIEGKIKSIDITNIYGITMNYDNRLIFELGDSQDTVLKLTIAQKLIADGEFDGEKGTLVLSQVSEASDKMKVTFRPLYETNKPDETPPKPDGGDVNIGDTTEPIE